MAALAIEQAMNLDEKAFHPFFSKTHRNHLDNLSITSFTPEEQEYTNDEGEGMLPLDGNRHDKGGRRKPKRTSKRKSEGGKAGEISKQPSLEHFGLNGTRSNTPADSSVELPTDPIVSLTEPSPEDDPNYARRKRRRTSASPTTPPLQWHEQLYREAYGSASLSTPDLSRSEEASYNHSEVVCSSERLIGENGCAREAGSTSPLKQSLNPESEAPQDTLPYHITAYNGQNAQQPTPPVKMLRLNAAGKLSSPASRPLSTDQGKNGTRGATRAKRSKPQTELIATMRYGKDEESRKLMAGQINDILSGGKSLQLAVPKEPRAAPQPIGPPKPVHPFFLGKTAGKKENQSRSQSNTANADKVPSKTESPKKTTVTPGKLRAQAIGFREVPAVPSFGSRISSLNGSRVFKAPGMSEAPWPWKGVEHIRASALSDASRAETQIPRGHASTWILPGQRRKRKGAVVSIPEDEDLLRCFAAHLTPCLSTPTNREEHRDRSDSLRLPRRLLTTGSEIQRHVRNEVHSALPYPELGSPDCSISEDELSLPRSTHPAILELYNSIPNTLTPFDNGECEPQAWTSKYAPKLSSHLLQPGQEVTVLRDWMKNLTVMAVESGNKEISKGQMKSKSKKAKGGTPKKKRNKRDGEFDDFIVLSGDESEYLDDPTDPEDLISPDSGYTGKSWVRGGALALLKHGPRSKRLTNAILLSGPPGCGKTAAVHAVAKELGFEVFEINPGSRRSGKDILDKVGDMAENHLVNQGSKDPPEAMALDSENEAVSEAFQKDLESGRQGTMQSFFKPVGKLVTPKPLKSSTAKLKKLEKPSAGKEEKAKTRHSQKQSLILLEEVDVLFEEDKQFWITIMSFMISSKRPIVMTCNDESLVPLDVLNLHAILRFKPPPANLATDYLLILAAREGHILNRKAVYSLFESKHYDLRASIVELNFWCQMAVGDRKGGLEWIYQRWPPGRDVDEHGRTLRVASIGTYETGMGWFSRDNLSGSNASTLRPFERGYSLLRQVWEEWGLDIRDGYQQLSDVAEPSTDKTPRRHSMHSLSDLVDLDMLFDTWSAADIFCRIGLPTSKEILDPTLPPITEKARQNFVEGLPLLQADPIFDYAQTDTGLAIATRLYCDYYATANELTITPAVSSAPLTIPITEPALVSSILTHQMTATRLNHSLSRRDFQCFDPISEAPSISAPSTSYPLTASSFDRTLALLATDLAPYVRSIVAYDLRLETERLRLSNLLCAGGQSGKRVRTTRASRSALEGGRREKTRRERWFDHRELNLELVMRTGGKGWAGMGCREVEGSERGSERGSVRGSREKDEI